MSVMFEVLYKSPSDSRREAVISERVGELGGRLTYREEPSRLKVVTRLLGANKVMPSR
jgi:hypothetical protein